MLAADHRIDWFIQVTKYEAHCHSKKMSEREQINKYQYYMIFKNKSKKMSKSPVCERTGKYIVTESSRRDNNS